MNFLQISGLLSPQLTQIMEYVTGTHNIEYLAEASPGTVNTTALWRVRKFTYDADGNLLNVKFANGSDDFNNAANAMSALTYS